MIYNELVAAIESYTENNFPDITLADGSTQTTQEQLNTFIKQAEQRVALPHTHHQTHIETDGIHTHLMRETISMPSARHHLMEAISMPSGGTG